MKIGVSVPQGHNFEFRGWDARRSWSTTIEAAKSAERLGFESVWMYDHFHTCPEPDDEVVFESFIALAAVAQHTTSLRLGHLVTCASYRNPALAAKMVSTLDAVSGGRVEFGLGAGWKEDEFRAYGYGFPDLPTRLGVLRDALAIASAMFRPGHATYEGVHASVRDAINVPKPLQAPRVPIIVGGNGPNVTWRLAARYADELNLDGLSPEAVAAALPIVEERCREIGRDPATLGISVHLWLETVSGAGPERQRRLSDYARLGVVRVMAQLRDHAEHYFDALEALAKDATAAGVELTPAASAADVG